MAMKFSLFLFIIIFQWLGALTASSTELKSPYPIIDVVSEEWPGFSNADGTGLYFDVMRRVYEPSGIKVNYKIQPILRSIASINKGERADVMLAEWHIKHLDGGGHYQKDNILFPKLPILGEYVEAVFKPGSSDQWRDIYNTQSSKIAWLRGYSYDHSLGVKGRSIVLLTSPEQGLKMLIKGNIDCYVNDRVEINQLMENEAYQNIDWRKELIMMRKLYPVFHNNEQGRYFKELYDSRMAQLIASGELFELYEAYGYDYHEALAEEIDPLH